ncbi:MAG: MFS transporter [Elusimicrobia bacterium]|nr:MFS transporter [Elusimicrobiota bacterium]
MGSKWRIAPERGTRYIKYSKEIWAWACYDFANSPFSTTITTVIFNVFFVTVVVGPGGFLLGKTLIPGSSLWAYLISFSTLLVGILSPILGAIADCGGFKKRFLIGFTLLGVFSTGMLFWAQEGMVLWSSFFFFVANLAFAGAFTFYNAFLPSLVSKEKLGSISGLGWALGYMGGGLCLALNLWMIQKPSTFHISSLDHFPVRFGFLLVAFWWLFFSLPLFLLVRESAPSSMRINFIQSIRLGLSRIRQTVRRFRCYPELFRFLMGYLLYNDGIETVIVVASIFAAEELGMKKGEIIQCFLMIQGVAFVGSLLFGRLADLWGNKKTILVTLLLWMGVLFWSFWMKNSWQFWQAGVLIGLILGGSQSASRSLFALFTPRENTAEFFGLFSLSGKVVATLGPLSFGLCRQILGSTRWAVGSLLFFFVLGSLFLLGVNEEKGLKESQLAVE